MNNFDTVLNVIVRFTLCLCLCLTSGALAYSGGDGTADNPYQIADANDWLLLTNDPNKWNKQFILTADIDLTDVNLTPVGNSNTRFTGIFDGNYHVIRNADINMPGANYVGLFGYLAGSGQIENLGVVDCNINAGDGDYVAGLVGSNFDYGHIQNCYVTGTVSGDKFVGGLVAKNTEIISNCYSMAKVSGNQFVGGLVGYNYSLITRCYSTGEVTAVSDAGGLIGKTSRGVTYNSFWDVLTSGQATSDGGRGKTTDQLKSADIYLGWGVENAWKLDAGSDYPRLIWESCDGENIIDSQPSQLYGGGTGTQQDPYLIYTAQQFNTIGLFWNHWDNHFKLMADIDLSVLDANSYNIIGAHYHVSFSFTGTFDGRGHIISGFNYTEGKYLLGLWGFVDSDNSVIQNLTIRDPQIITPGAECVGSLAGYHIRGKIMNCHVINGTISAQANLGGLVGRNSANGYIIRCSADCDVTGPLPSDPPGTKERYGALVGENNGHIDQCRSSGSVYGNKMVGGLVGLMWDGEISNSYSTADVELGDYWCIGGLVGVVTDAVVRNCFSTGVVDVGQGDGAGGFTSSGTNSDYYNCFWDIQTSGFPTSCGATGKTTAQMKSISTFTSAGWDFYGETANGTEDIWKMCVGGDGYPKLSWEEGTPFTYYINLAGFQQAGQDAYFFKAYDAASQALLTQIRYGQQIQIKYMVKNLGTRRAGQFTVSFYISNDSTIGDADDYKLAASDFYSAGLAAGAYQAKTSSVLTLPSAPPAGYTAATTIYLGMKVDSQNTVVEPNETNNYNTGVGIDKRALAVRTVNLTGYVKTSGGSALSGVTVTVSGGLKTTTNTSGYYVLKVPYKWTGKITPTKTGYSFVPSYLSYTGVTASRSSQNFIAYVRPTISGYVKSPNGTALSGVTITASSGGGTTTTNTSGYYALKVPYKWTGKITPTKTGRTFTPTSRSYTAVISSKTSQNFSSP
ncbi:MAG: hypothetical protein A2Y07_10835 [Planctomycetes bacterium GWF2_50_10]|nr:MAG: hypothetical protein A2Y07_10835 [Planctomycetes bacterium GWF2_50_10]